MFVNCVCMHSFAANYPGRPVIPRNVPAAATRNLSWSWIATKLPAVCRDCLDKPSYFFTGVAGSFGVALAVGPPVSSAFTAGLILSAFFTSCATCHICVSVK